MFNLNYSIFILTSFFHLMASVIGRQCSVTTGMCCRIENPNIKIGTLVITIPETICFYVKTSLITLLLVYYTLLYYTSILYNTLLY